MEREDDILKKKELLQAMATLLQIIFSIFDKDFTAVTARNLEESIPEINSRYGTSFQQGGVPVARFFYTLCLGIAHRRGDVRLTPEGRARLHIKTVKEERSNGDGDFFAYFDESSMDGLKSFLEDRKFTMVSTVQDAKGKPLVKLGYKAAIRNPKERLQERGVIWFPNKELMKEILPTIKQYRSEP